MTTLKQIDRDDVLPKYSILKREAQLLSQQDCGDNSCLFSGRGKGGMRTNGGCRCYDNYGKKSIDSILKLVVHGDSEALAKIIHEEYWGTEFDSAIDVDRNSAYRTAIAILERLPEFLKLNKGSV